TDDSGIRALRERFAKNLIATLMLSQGVPMVLAGDEFLRTQHGNNNAWCQDDEVSWVDWELAARNAGFHRFVREMIAFRMRHPALRRRTFFRGTPVEPSKIGPDIVWHGPHPGRPDFSPESHAIAFSLDGRQTGREHDDDLYIALNA